jgi:hypothetical protein
MNSVSGFRCQVSGVRTNGGISCQVARCQCSALPLGDEEAGLIEKETEVSYKVSVFRKCYCVCLS